MNRRAPIAHVAVLVAGVLCATAPAAGGELARRTAAAVERSKDELESLESGEHAAAADGEIARARREILDARAALERGDDARAAMLAERLERQIALVRAVIACAAVAARADAAAERVAALERRVAALRERLDRLEIEARGADVTDAYPRPPFVAPAAGEESP